MTARTVAALQDAHCHLHFADLDACRAGLAADMERQGIGAAVVNGTGAHDWDEVAAACTAHPAWLPAFGVHPWRAAEQLEGWEGRLCALLDAHPQASVGEIGLDQWIDLPLAVQEPVFRRQWEIARERNVPASVHCVRAWEPMRQFCRRHAAPGCGFLLHAYNGPAEMVPFFVECGARFSFSTYFLHPRKAPAHEAFRRMPLDRLLIETDAPDLAPPVGHILVPAGMRADGKPVNHPANLPRAMAALAEIRGMSADDLAPILAQNWTALFGLICSAH